VFEIDLNEFLQKGFGYSMALEYTIDSIEGLDENTASLYRQEGELFVLDVEGLPEPPSPQVEEPVALKNTLTKVRQEKRDIERKLKQYKGVDVNEYHQNRQELQEIKEAEEMRKQEEADEIARKNGEWESRKQELEAGFQKNIEKIKSEYEAKVAEKDAAAGRYYDELKTNLLHSEVVSAVSREKGKIDILKPHLLSSLAVEDDDGRGFRVVVKDGEGNVRFGETGDPMTAHDLVKEFKEREDFSVLFESDITSGSNSTSNTTTDASAEKNNPWMKETLNLTEQVRLLKTNPKKAERLKKAAGK